MYIVVAGGETEAQYRTAWLDLDVLWIFQTYSYVTTAMLIQPYTYSFQMHNLYVVLTSGFYNFFYSFYFI